MMHWLQRLHGELVWLRLERRKYQDTLQRLSNTIDRMQREKEHVQRVNAQLQRDLGDALGELEQLKTLSIEQGKSGGKDGGFCRQPRPI